MSYDAAFGLLNLSVVPAWVLLLVLPRAKITKVFVHSGLYPALLGVFYIIVMGLQIFFGHGAVEGGNFFTVSGISALFQHPHGVMIGWSHYLVFDLFVGAWIGRDAARQSISHFAAAPCQLLTFIFGPVGLFCYMLLRVFSGRGFGLDEHAIREEVV